MCIPVFLQYYILVFIGYVGLPELNFLLDIDTGMTKIPSFQFYTSISPCSSVCAAVSFYLSPQSHLNNSGWVLDSRVESDTFGGTELIGNAILETAGAALGSSCPDVLKLNFNN